MIQLPANPPHALGLLPVATLATGLAALILGIWIAARERLSRVSVPFLYLCLAVAVWFVAFAWMYLAPEPEAALRWARIAYLGVPLIPAAVYQLAVHAVGKREQRRMAILLAWALGYSFVVTALTGRGLLAGVDPHAWGYYPRYGPTGLPFLGYFFAVLGLAMAELVTEYRAAPPGRSRLRTRALVLALSVAVLAAVDFLPKYGVPVPPLGLVPLFGSLAALAWTIQRYRLVDLTASFAADQILATVGDALVVCDVEGRIRLANQAACSLFGFARAELVGAGIERLAEDDAAAAARLRAALAGPALRDEEMVLRTRHGEPIEASVAVSRLHDQDGQPVGAVVVARDISERKRAAEALRSSEEQLRQAQKMEAVGRLAGGIAHDFNNLLTVIQGHAEILLAESGADEGLREGLEEVRRAARHAEGLTRQLLAFSRKQVLQPRVLDLNAVVSNLGPMLRRLIGEDIELTSSLEPGLGKTRADPAHVEQVIMNLAVNARDAMPRGGRLTLETADVELDEDYARAHAGVEPGRYVRLSVSDTGHGMDRETAARIFEPFFTTKEKGKGTGLGLSTVYGIVKQSGGHIWVYSEPGQGTTFKIYLPRVEGEAEEEAAAGRAEAPEPDGTETVLLVEDEEPVRALARRILERRGYRVLEAAGGPQALEATAGLAEPIHLLLTDVVMPGMSGRELAERLLPLRPGLRVLYMSGYTDEAVVKHGVLTPGTAFLQKPFTPAALARKVREVLDAPPA